MLQTLKIMKKVFLGVLFFTFLFILDSQAQDPNRPNSIIFKRVITDYHSTQGEGDIVQFENYRGGFEAAYLKNLGKNLNFNLPIRVGVFNLPTELNNQTFLGIDGLLQLQFFSDSAAVIPYITAGAGFQTDENDGNNIQVPVGAGLYVKLGRYSYLNLEGQYRKSFVLDRDHIQLGAGLGFMIGKILNEEITPPVEVIAPDQDEDGIPDREDNCPEVYGVAAFSGCPDTDGDGIQDATDDCPEEVGPVSTNGCPDRDGDGFSDLIDECPDASGVYKGCPDSDDDGLPDDKDDCPNQPGPVNNQGCPQVDSDGDGTPDAEDKCPNVSGPKSTKGCPDTDNDGLDDSQDRCPTSSGPLSNQGCPEITQQDRAILEYAIQAVQFETGSSTLKTESYSVLNQVAGIMTRYPDYKLTISGHTDNVGEENNNQQLSERRAKSCFDYLISNGSPISKISYVGYGESQPIADNTTREGRSMNRRVEFNLIPQ